MTEPPSWICAPDSFKGTVDAPMAAAALAEGIRAHTPTLQVLERPMADGGEGTMEAVFMAQGGVWRRASSMGPLASSPVQQRRWLLSGSGWGVVELAEAAGVTLLEPSERDPELATSYGVGQILLEVLQDGPSHVLLGLGGSATVDGGLGLLQALGAVLKLQGGAVLERPCTGADLLNLEGIDLGRARERFEGVDLVVAADVSNPLLGEDGAACMYGPQKGAGPQGVKRLERGLGQLAQLLGDPGIEPGDGAAGGAGYGVRVGLGARTRPGAALVAELIGLPEACERADLVVTGEGCYDEQTRFGKVPWEVARLAGAAGVRSALVAGSIRATQVERAEDPFELHVSLEELDEGAEATHVERLRAAGFHLATRLMG